MLLTVWLCVAVQRHRPQGVFAGMSEVNIGKIRELLRQNAFFAFCVHREAALL